MDTVQTTPPSSHNRHTRLRMIGLIFGIFLIIGVAYMAKLTINYYQQIATGTIDLRSFEQGGQTTVSTNQPVGTIRNDVVANFSDDPSIGPENARLTIVMFEDFQCPFCRQQFTTLRNAITKYSDRVRFVYRDFPISEIHADAEKAAEAGNCAHEQGQFWPYHDKLYLNADRLTVNDLKLYARQLHLDTAVFDNCLDTGKYSSEVAADFADGIAAGVTGTPTFFFNGNRVAGVISEEGFEQIIEFFIK